MLKHTIIAMAFLAGCVAPAQPEPSPTSDESQLCKIGDDCPNWPIQPVKDATLRTANNATAGQTVVSRGPLLCSGDSTQTTCGISVELSNVRIDARCHQQVDDGGIWCESRVCSSSGCSEWMTTSARYLRRVSTTDYAGTQQYLTVEPLDAVQSDLCNLNPNTCPGWAIQLRGDTERNGKVWASAHYPGVAFSKPSTSCVSGPGWGSCEWHVDLGLVHVTYGCVGDADDEGNLTNEACDVIDVEVLLAPEGGTP
jgi:hypothetical protein